MEDKSIPRKGVPKRTDSVSNKLRFLWLSTFLTMISLVSYTQNVEEADDRKTTFKFGGYVKADFLNTWYNNGDVASESPMRDIHLPSQIPIGSIDRNYDLDFHIKESRINFDVRTKLFGKEIQGFVEMDFLLSDQGDEKVTNSFNPRLRHFYFEWNGMLIGQTWSTFMMVVLPDEIDFSGAMDGLVFVRQPQFRYMYKNWWFALENPETTVNKFSSAAVTVTESEVFPDVIVRRNFEGDWGNWGLAGIYRMLHTKDSLHQTTPGYGITTGGKLYVGDRGDDFRIVATAGKAWDDICPPISSRGQ